MSAAPLEVQEQFRGKIIGGVVLLVVAVSPCFASAIYGAMTGSDKIGNALFMAVVVGLVFGLVPGVQVWRKRRSVKRFDETGVTRFDGVQLPWSEYRSAQRTMKRWRSGSVTLWKVELQFASGSADVIPQLIGNSGEVLPAVEKIEAGQNPWRS